MAVKFTSHEMSLRVSIERRKAYQRTSSKEMVTVFTLESLVREADSTQVYLVETKWEGYLLDALIEHVRQLKEMQEIDCTYLLARDKYLKIFLPWAYSQESLQRILKADVKEDMDLLNYYGIPEKEMVCS